MADRLNVCVIFIVASLFLSLSVSTEPDGNERSAGTSDWHFFHRVVENSQGLTN